MWGSGFHSAYLLPPAELFSLVTNEAIQKQGMPWHARTTAGGAPHLWHENYYEHIIRNERELNRIREYICTNPLRWPYDVENPACESEAADDIEELLAADDDERYPYRTGIGKAGLPRAGNSESRAGLRPATRALFPPVFPVLYRT